MAGAVIAMMQKIDSIKKAANEDMWNAPVARRSGERNEDQDVDLFRARTPSNNNTPRPTLAPEKVLGADYGGDVMSVKAQSNTTAQSYTTASYTSGGSATSHHSGGPVLWRAVFDRYRFGKLNLLTPAPLMYIQLVLRHRCAERAFMRSLVSHTFFVVLIVSMIFSQRSVINVYQMETSISNFFGGLATRRADGASSVTLDTITSIDDIWTWTRGALMPVTLTNPETLNDGRIVIRMYNQLVGSVRITQRAVYDGSCLGSTTLLNQSPQCYSALTRDKMDNSPFGPWYDHYRYKAARSAEGWDEYTVDLGTDSNFATARILDMINTGFIGPRARHLSIDMLFYNNAFNLFCYTRIVFVTSPSGAIDVQEFYETVPVEMHAGPRAPRPSPYKHAHMLCLHSASRLVS